MKEEEYTKILDEAYKDLPKILHKKNRFEIPKVTGKIIKTRTIISNFKEIVAGFDRDENHLFKFFLKDIGIRGEINSKSELVLHSRFTPTILNKSIKKYFINFVQCPYCLSPDTILDNLNKFKCKACGYEEIKKKI